MLISLQAFQVLNSKMLHDLISPNSAISNGIELLEEMGADPDCIGLIQNSSSTLKYLLTYYRIAYGSGGLPAQASDYYREIQNVGNPFFKPKHIVITWHEESSCERASYINEIKLLANLLLLSSEILPRGGNIEVLPDHQSYPFSIQIKSATIKLNDHDLMPIIKAELFDENENLDINNIRSYFASSLAKELGLSIDITKTAQDTVKIKCLSL